MVQINGKYRLEKNDNFVQYLVGFGIPEEKAKQADQLRPEIEVTLNGNDVTITSNSAVLSSPSKWVLGQEVDDPLPFGIVIKSTATLNGDTLTVASRADDGVTGQRIYKFTDAGVVLSMSSSKAEVPPSSRTYVRI